MDNFLKSSVIDRLPEGERDRAVKIFNLCIKGIDPDKVSFDDCLKVARINRPTKEIRDDPDFKIIFAFITLEVYNFDKSEMNHHWKVFHDLLK